MAIKSKRIEIERKFLVKNNSWQKGARGINFQQGYLSTESFRTVRVRLEGKVGKLTIKGKKTGIAGDELEYDIPIADAKYLLDNICMQPIIYKKRFRIPFENLIWEVDVFKGENKGLILAEVELKRVNQKIKLPSWVGKDVTHDRRFRNANLVKNPFSYWKHELIV